MSMKGRRHTEEAKRKIALAVSLRQKGNKIWLGKTHSEESKGKMRKSALERGIKPPGWSGKKLSEEHVRSIRISKTGDRNPNFGKPRSIETRKKMSEAQKGDKSHAWRGGRYPAHLKIRDSLEYKLWRESVFARDNYTCQICGIVGGKLNADHLKRFSEYPDLHFELSNGRTLCEDCHRTTDNFGGRGLRRVTA